MLKALILAVPAFLAQPAMAAVVSMDLSFGSEFFQNVVDFGSGEDIPVVTDGEPFGFTGRFSHLAAGDLVHASFTIDQTVSGWDVSDCVFAGADCESIFVSIGRDLNTLSLAGFGTTSLNFNFLDQTAVYYEDGPGGRSGLGLFDFYGAEFDITSVSVGEPSSVPLPASGWVLVAALGALAIAGRRRLS